MQHVHLLDLPLPARSNQQSGVTPTMQLCKLTELQDQLSGLKDLQELWGHRVAIPHRVTQCSRCDSSSTATQRRLLGGLELGCSGGRVSAARPLYCW